MKNPVTRFLSELVLWNVANVVCMAVPTALTFYVGSELLNWGPGYLGFYVTAALMVSLTWGSWAGLVWTRNRAIRGGMLATTTFPGLLTLAGGVAGLWAGFGAWYMWAGIIGAGVGTIAVAIGLSRFFRPVNREPRLSSYVFGLAIYPLVATVLAMGIGAMWYNFVTTPASGDWRDIVSIATLYVTVIASALTSTVIPAALSSSMRKVAGDVLPRRR